MAPEYLVHGHLTEKADVYSFGVLVLEIITGKRCSGSVGSHAGHLLLSQAFFNPVSSSLLYRTIPNHCPICSVLIICLLVFLFSGMEPLQVQNYRKNS